MLSAQLLLSKDVSSVSPDAVVFDFEEVYNSQNQPPERNVINLRSKGDDVTVIVYNSLAYPRSGNPSSLL